MLNNDVELRKYPYPYRSMLSICSDLDETPDKNVYLECSKFLNTSLNTSMGVGVNLEVGNTIYFDMPTNQFSYVNTDDNGRTAIHYLIQSGHIDCIHSFGDFVDERKRAIECLNMLKNNNCFVQVWVDHARAPTNIDSQILFGKGNDPESDCYIADLLVEYGIAFIWKGRVTSIISQNTKRSYKGIFNYLKPYNSAITILKELIKYLLGMSGNIKYKMHALNKLLGKLTLSTGDVVYEFMRTNPSWAGVSSHENAAGIQNVICKKVLEQLVKSQGCSVLYTHLGKITDRNKPFSNKTVEAFKLLSNYYKKGDILVATTRRVLGYQRTLNELKCRTFIKEDTVHIDVTTKYSDKDIEGLTWYIPENMQANLRVNGCKIEFKYNPPDFTGRKSISIPWNKLQYPKIT